MLVFLLVKADDFARKQQDLLQNQHKAAIQRDRDLRRANINQFNGNHQRSTPVFLPVSE